MIKEILGYLHIEPSRNINFPVFSVNSHLVPERSLTFFFTFPVPRCKEAKDLQMYTVVRLLALQAVNIALTITQMLAYAIAVADDFFNYLRRSNSSLRALRFHDNATT